MNIRIAALRQRRTLLVARAAVQRSEVAQCVRPWKTPLTMLDTLLEAARLLRRYSMVTALAAAVLVSSRQRRRLLWAGRLFALWEVLQALRAQWPKQPSRPKGYAPDAGGRE